MVPRGNRFDEQNKIGKDDDTKRKQGAHEQIYPQYQYSNVKNITNNGKELITYAGGCVSIRG